MNGYQTYKRTSVQTADRVKLVVMLYEKMISNLNQVIKHLESGNSGTDWSSRIANTLEIIKFLVNSLDHENGKDISINLAQMYDYVRDVINEGNIKKDVEKFRQAIELLGTMLEGWQGISNQTPVPGLRNANAAGNKTSTSSATKNRMAMTA